MFERTMLHRAEAATHAKVVSALLMHPLERGIRSKVGIFDKNVAVDSPYLVPCTGKFRTILVANRAPTAVLWPVSHDTVGSLRDLPPVQELGRWALLNSVLRYRMQARATQETARVLQDANMLATAAHYRLAQLFHDPAVA